MSQENYKKVYNYVKAGNSPNLDGGNISRSDWNLVEKIAKNSETLQDFQETMRTGELSEPIKLSQEELSKLSGGFMDTLIRAIIDYLGG